MGSSSVDYEQVAHFVNQRGQKIFCHYWDELNGAEPKALVFICHGAGEHCLWYDVIAEPLAKQGCYVFAHDHVGHGKSEGTRVHVDDVNEYIEDIIQHVGLIRAKYPTQRLFIVGHSMGGLLTAKTVIDYPSVFSGAALLGAAITPNPETVTRWKVLAAKALAWILPQCPIGKIESEWICRNSEVGKMYDADPLVYHGGMKAKWGMVILSAMQGVQERLNEIEVPLLILHGDSDKICEVSGAHLVDENVKSKDKTLKIFPGAYHNLQRETEGVAEETISTITEWIMARA